MTKVFGISGDMLKQYVDKIERLELEKAEVLEAIRDTYSDAKSQGFDVKILRKVISARKIEASKLEEEETLIIMYKRALGMLPDLDNEDIAA
jgi:uncharacterized protein (UPF0335 family)